MTHINLIDLRMLFLTSINISSLRQNLYVNKYSVKSLGFITHVYKGFCHFFPMFQNIRVETIHNIPTSSCSFIMNGRHPLLL
jgi:hypothetical protein